MKERCSSLLEQNKLVGILGGEQSVALGLIQALNDRYDDFGVLHVDAHADLKVEYLGFEQSHASIMRNVLNTCANMSRLIQVGVRELSEVEFEFSKEEDRVSTYFDWAIKKDILNGKSWLEIIREIIDEMPKNIYISFDIDGLKPYLCPNTGMPADGGFELNEIQLLFSEIISAGKNIMDLTCVKFVPAMKIISMLILEHKPCGNLYATLKNLEEILKNDHEQSLKKGNVRPASCRVLSFCLHTRF